jgi:membrane protease YdiL (CAAX protease family)
VPPSLSALPSSPALLLLAAGVLYALFHHLGQAEVWQERLRARGYPDETLARSVLLQRLSGALLLGVVPAVGFAAATGAGPAEMGLGAWRGGGGGLLLAAAVLLPGVAWAARRPAHRVRYPQVRVEVWTARLRTRHALGWAVYLFGYELLFRGLLLFPLAAATDPWTAVLASSGLYVLAHLDKDLGECLACAPMGLVFAALALAAGSIWPALALHLAIAVTSDTVASWGPRGRARGEDPRLSEGPVGAAGAGAPSPRLGTRARARV